MIRPSGLVVYILFLGFFLPPVAGAQGPLSTADSVRAEFLHAWEGYRQYAWGHDELMPLSSGDDWANVPDRFLSDWIIMQRIDLPADRRYTGFRPLHELLVMEKWKIPERDPGPVWTDAYSNLLSVIHWR